MTKIKALGTILFFTKGFPQCHHDFKKIQKNSTKKQFGMYCVLKIVLYSEHTLTNKYTYFCIPLLHITPNRHF